MPVTTTHTDTPFLRIPTEIRFQIYSLLLINHDRPTVSFRTEDASLWELRKCELRRRSKYRHMPIRLRAGTIESTYHLLENPGIHASILGTNRQIHTEASDVLYSHHLFDFGFDIESIVPFLSDLTPTALSFVKRICLSKRSLPYDKDFDRCEWGNACAFISQNMRIAQLDLVIAGGKPDPRWDSRETYHKMDFGVVAEFEGMPWARQISAIKGLQVLNVKADLRHCPSPMNSRAMAFFVDFSATIEGGFADWLRGKMVVGAA